MSWTSKAPRIPEVEDLLRFFGAEALAHLLQSPPDETRLGNSDKENEAIEAWQRRWRLAVASVVTSREVGMIIEATRRKKDPLPISLCLDAVLLGEVDVDHKGIRTLLRDYLGRYRSPDEIERVGEWILGSRYAGRRWAQAELVKILRDLSIDDPVPALKNGDAFSEEDKRAAKYWILREWLTTPRLDVRRATPFVRGFPASSDYERKQLLELLAAAQRRQRRRVSAARRS
jgi:hypothetical protein